MVNEFNLTGCPLIISLNAKRTVAAVNKQSNRTTLHSRRGVKWDIDCARVCACVSFLLCLRFNDDTISPALSSQLRWIGSRPKHHCSKPPLCFADDQFTNEYIHVPDDQFTDRSSTAIY